MLHAVIMAGGSGTRFWPRSTESRPKQFLNIFGDRTMLQSTVDRIESLIPPEGIWVITNDKYVDLVQEQLPEVPAQNIVGEPVAKNTAPCVALAAALIQEKDPDATMVVLPADHQISDPEKFRSILQAAKSKAQDEQALVTIGINPGHPETGYGYIEFDKEASESFGDHEIKKVNQFREKPDLDTAKSFLEAGNFLWNSGMFIWQAATILDEFKEHLPSVYRNITELSPAIGSTKQKKAVNNFYRACPSISIDYGIMEQSQSVFVVPGSFGWNDVGSWSAVYELREKDKDGNAIQASHSVLVGSTDNLIHSQSNKLIALVGVKNLAVVETDDAILVCNMDESQDVKKVVKQLRDKEELKKFL